MAASRASAAARLSGVLACGLLLAAATILGYEHGGPAIGLAALGLSALAAVSLLVPRR